MHVRCRLVQATPDQVWAVLADGWMFSLWTVGATSVRDVDDDWPAAGSVVRHISGFWPLNVDRTSEVVACEPPSRLVVRLHGVVPGAAELEVRLHPTGEGTRVEVEQRFTLGPLRVLPSAVRRPLLRPADDETLLRLAHIAENRDRE